jgi:hypothetical protein
MSNGFCRLVIGRVAHRCFCCQNQGLSIQGLPQSYVPAMNDQSGIHIIDMLSVNSLMWLRSLPEEERGPSSRITEDLEMLTVVGGLRFQEIAISSRSEMTEALHEIARSAAQGLRPILHFDCHGSANNGLQLAPSREFMSWEELADLLRVVNVATGNNLCCVFAACFGLQLGTILTLSKAVPFYLMIAPPKEIDVGSLERKILPFYREVHESGNITESHRAMLAPELQILNCKGLFAQSLARYIAQYCHGKAAAARRERLVTESLLQRGITSPSRAQLRATRQQIKAKLKPSQDLIDYFAPKFLIGGSPGFAYHELKRLADSQRRHHVSSTALG